MTMISIARSYVLRRLVEALHIRRPLSPFMQAVIAERYRQVEVERWIRKRKRHRFRQRPSGTTMA